MRRGKAGRLAVATLIAGMFLAPSAWAENKPPAGRNAPPQKGAKADGPDAGKERAPGKGKGFFELPEKDDEVLVRGKGR